MTHDWPLEIADRTRMSAIHQANPILFNTNRRTYTKVLADTLVQ